MRGIPMFWYKKETQVFDTEGVEKEISGDLPLAAGGSGTLKRTKPPREEKSGALNKNKAGVEMSNHLNLFYAAVSALAGHGNIKQRLIQAFEENLATIEVDDLPVVVKEPFADLRKMMSGVDPLNGEGRIRATVRKMSVIEADECAQMMIDLYTEIVRFDDQAGDSMSVKIDDKQIVPPFRIKSV